VVAAELTSRLVALRILRFKGWLLIAKVLPPPSLQSTLSASRVKIYSPVYIEQCAAGASCPGSGRGWAASGAPPAA